jgi:hypothetical protein
MSNDVKPQPQEGGSYVRNPDGSLMRLAFTQPRPPYWLDAPAAEPQPAPATAPEGETT